MVKPSPHRTGPLQELERILNWQLSVLRLLGCTAYEPNFRFTVMTVFIISLAAIFIVITLFDLHLFWGDTFNFAFALVTISYALIGCTRLGVILSNPDPYAQLVGDVKETYELASRSSDREQQILWGFTKLLKQCVVLYSVTFLGGCVGSGVLPVVVYLWNGERILPFGVVVPYTDPDTSVGYFVNYAYQVSCILWTPPGLAASQNVYFVLVFNICIQYDMLAAKLDELNEMILRNRDGALDSAVHEKLIEIVNYQQRLIRFIAEIDRLYTSQIFVEISCNALQVVLTLFVMQIGTWMPGYFVVLVATYQLFVYCLLGTLIDLKSELFTEQIYNVAWHDMHAAEQRKVQFILAKSQQSRLLSYGGMTPLNMKLFLVMYKKIYSIFMMLQNV